MSPVTGAAVLLDVLKRLLRPPAAGAADTAQAPAAKVVKLQESAPLLKHLEILFGGVRFGEHRFIDMLEQCARETATDVYPRNLFRRAESGLQLARYFIRSLALDGARVECGVYRGMSSLLLCRIAAAHDPAFRGERYFMIDSFERFSAPGHFDLIPQQARDGTVRMGAPFPPNARVDTSLEHVRKVFTGFPDARIVQGYIPAVLSELPETPWAFVHLDVDLYEPTLRGLEYFFPRLVPGGAIITDDYGSERYPGARRAWDEFCTARDVPFVTFSCGQAVIIR